MQGTDRRILSRRTALRHFAGCAAVASAAGRAVQSSPLEQRASDITVIPPRNRVPLSFIIDDSTCLVNMGHFCTPQFAAVYPDRAEYQQPWQSWPREIPDSFVREFGEWCALHGVRGKYSVVPCPAAVGRLDRFLPGWSADQLADSLQLVRDLMIPNWDIHPEMLTHTRIIDLKTGWPVPEATPATMENSWPQEDVSTDQIADYLVSSLQILRNCGLPCEGITTPGGFGNRVRDRLPVAVQQAIQDVFPTDVPHYFKYVRLGEESVIPAAEAVSGVDSEVPQITMNVPAGTGDWFGGWQGIRRSEPDRYSTEEATAGRLVELIERGDPAIMLCHWPGMYCNGTKTGFHAFQRVVAALASRFADRTLWLKISEIARYYAAREFTRWHWTGSALHINAPFAASNWTMRLPSTRLIPGAIRMESETQPLENVSSIARLMPNTFFRDSEDTLVCFDLRKGNSVLQFRSV